MPHNPASAMAPVASGSAPASSSGKDTCGWRSCQPGQLNSRVEKIGLSKGLSRMRGNSHVRFLEGLGGRNPGLLGGVPATSS
jgi:hypothetical protein